MKCIICRGQDIQVTEVREEIKVNSDIVYLPIQIPVCRTCGERYYDRRTMRFLEEEEQQLRAGNVKLEEVGKVLRHT